MAAHARAGDGSRPGRRPRVLASLTLAAGLALSGVVAWLHARGNEALADREFAALADDTSHRLFERFRLYEYGLRGARGNVLGAGEGLTRRGFRVYHESRDLAAEFPGARGFGFIRRVPAEREADFLAAARRDGAPDFAIRQLAPHDRERYVIQYIEPVERNRQAIGLDIASEANRRAAADLALKTGNAAITRPITLVQAPDEQLRGFLVLLPIYRPGTPLAGDADAIGWAYAPIVIAEVLAGFDFHGGAVSMALYDGEAEDGPREQFFGPEAPAASPLVRRVVRPMFGRTWEVELRAEPAFFTRLNLLPARTVLAIGALISALLAALLYAYLLSDERRRQLVAEKLRLATIVENSSDAIVAETLDGIVTGWNRAAERIFGMRADEAVGRPAAELIPATEGEAGSMLVSVGSGTAAEPFDRLCRRRDGSLVEVTIAVTPITASDGRVIGVGKTIRDVSAHKEAERRLREFNAQLERLVGERTAQLETARRDLQTLLDALPSMVGYWDASMTCRFANRAYQQWFGVDPRDLPGRHIRDLLGERLFAANLPHIEAALRGEAQLFERALPRPDGHGVRHSLAHYLPDVVDGQVRGFYVLVHDVTELNEGRQKLAEAMRAAEAASAAKSEFLANMSHEIRTPLHAILGMAHLLERSALDDEQRRFVSTIQIAGQGLLGIINSVLDLAKIEAGGVALELAPFDLRAMIEELGAMLEPQARTRQLELTLEVAADLPPVLAGDGMRVRQILVNLLSNAIKFTELGSVRLVVAVSERTAEQIRVSFTVRDTGVGIPVDVQARLFAPFIQADASTTRRFGGTGLGLSIVRRLVDLMGGEVGLHSEVGRGSEFRVALPFAVVAAPEGRSRDAGARVARAPRLAGVRALVVDDNEINCEVAARILASEGAVVTTGADGLAALDHLRAASDGFDVVLMDVQMPRMDGNEATARIRGELGLAELPVIAVTAGALVAERKRSLDAGVTDFISKPLAPDALVRTILRHLAARRATTA